MDKKAKSKNIPSLGQKPNIKSTSLSHRDPFTQKDSKAPVMLKNLKEDPPKKNKPIPDSPKKLQTTSEINTDNVQKDQKPLTEEVDEDQPQELTQEELAQQMLKEQEDMARYRLELQRRKEELRKELLKFSKIEVRQNDYEKMICINADGFDGSMIALDIIMQEFLYKLDASIICAYIYNALKEEKYYQHQKETVIEKYKVKMLTNFSDEKGHFVIQERNFNYKHYIEQVKRIAILNRCSYLFINYDGLVTPAFKEKYRSQGLDSILEDCVMPTMILKKEIYPRGKKNPGYKWLLTLDRESDDCIKAIDFFLQFIDFEKDFIYCLTFIPYYIKFDDMEQRFYDKMEEIGFDKERTMYQMVKNRGSDSMAKFMTKFVNRNEEHYFDFIIFYNNADKYKAQRENSELYKMIPLVRCNFCIVSYLYTDMVQETLDKYREQEAEKKRKEAELKRILDQNKKITQQISNENKEKEEDKDKDKEKEKKKE